VSTDGINFVTDCTMPAVSPTPTPTQYRDIKIMSNTGETIAFSCSSGDILSNGASLIDTNTVEASSCFFTCNQDTFVSVPHIGINFTLTNAKEGNFTENKTTVPFNTSVTLRNTNR
ncbi:MAG: hypothetical protein WD967_02615, partial [Candidatus Levyibacteriota bacterium]